MPENDKLSGSASTKSSRGGEHRPSVAQRLEQFEKRQRELWIFTLVLLFALAVFFAWTSWASLRTFASRYEGYESLAPALLVVVVVLFGVNIWRKTREISELRGLVRGIEQRDAEPPSDKQLDQLFEVIARSQQGYRDLIDSFDDVLLALTMEGEIRAVNRSFSDLVATPFQLIIGKPLSDFVEDAGGDGPDVLKRALPRFLERRTWSGVVHVRLKSQSSSFFFDCVAHAMMRADKIHGVTVLCRDITASRKNEARFTELFETLQEGIYITTPAGNIVDANPALVRMLGYDSKEELLKKQVPEIFVDKIERKLIRDEVERQPMLQGREITLLRKDGNKITCLNTAAAVRDTAGTVLRYQGALMDITERREMERRLYQQQEFARRLVDSFPDLILVLDSAAGYTFVSPRSKEILGYDPQEIQAMEFAQCSHPEDIPALRALFDDIVSRRQIFASLETRVRHKNGQWRLLRFNFSPLSDETGAIDGVVMSGRDVTDLKRLEEQLIQAEKLAAMGQMLAGVAHELNNPLTAILGVTELLRERSGMDDSAKRQLELTHRQARRAARIVQNLLEFSRPASPQKKSLDVHSLIERTIQLHEHSLRRNNIELDFPQPAGLPGIIGDANQLIQVFLNLITNAEQAIREIRDSGRIQIRLGRVGSRLAITVQDDGVGIRPEALPKIFDPFYTTKRPGGGTGLGLSICMSIVREHGGNIEADALPAGGSAFTVYLPIASETPTRDTKPETETPAAGVPVPQFAALGQHSERTVLVVDDEESIRMLLEEGLSAHRFRVDCAATPEEALTLAEHRPYDAILCDLNLTAGGVYVNGKDVTGRILAATGHRKPALIYMTGDLVQQEEKPPGPDDPRYLQKPFRISDVLALLNEITPVSTAGTSQD
jgi:two-component system NtrC family sensor kinase